MKSTSGPVTVRYYRTPVDGYDSYTVVWREGSSRKSKRFQTKKKARAFAGDKARQLAAGHLRTISTDERASIDRALELLKPTGKPLEVVAAEYASMFKLLDGASPIEAARFFQARHGKRPERTVEAVYNEMMAGKQKDDLSDPYLKDLAYRMKAFKKAFRVNVSAITGPMLNEWLQSLAIVPRTRQNYRGILNTFFEFAKSQNYLPRDWDELRAVKIPKPRQTSVSIFTPEQLTRLLVNANTEQTLWLCLSAFAGIRHAELRRLDWSDIDLQRNWITVKGKVRTASRRLVPILPNLSEWLRPHWKRTGSPFSYQNMGHSMLDLSRRKSVKIVWKHNVLRHSFISYRLADLQDAAKVSLEAGNSPKMIFSHYREIVTPTDAANWFDIVPEIKKKVIAA